MKTLFEIVAQANAIEQAIIENSGELSPELEAALSNVDLVMSDKIDGYDAVMTRLDINASYWKAKAEQYAKIAKTISNVSDRLNANIKAALISMGKTEVSGNDVTFRLSKVKPKLIINDAALEESYKMQVTKVEPDKERIRTALEDGFEVKGARLEQGFALRAYAKKGEK